MKRKKLITLVVAGMLALGAVGGTFAWLTSEDSAQNNFKTVQGPSDCDKKGIDIYEKFEEPNNVKPGDTTTKLVQIKNTSTFDQFIRVKITPKWTDGEGKDYKNSDIIPNFNDAVKTDMSAGSWYKDGDYYYYMGKVKSGDFTNPILNSVTLNGKTLKNDIMEKKFEVEIETNGVQASNGAYVDEFSGISEELKTKLSELQNDPATYGVPNLVDKDMNNNTKPLS